MSRNRYFRIFMLTAVGISLQTAANAGTLWQGYYDFEFYSKTNSDIAQPSYFDQHHLSTFVQHNYKNITLFGEIEYERAQVLNVKSDGTLDSASFGKFLIETVWANVEFERWFQVRAGQMLVPTWWQTFHYPNIVLTIAKPNIIKNVFPGADNGVMFHGDSRFDFATLGYKFWVGNGQENNPTMENQDAQFSKGLRFEAKDFGFFDTSEIGFMYMSSPRYERSAAGSNGMKNQFTDNIAGVDGVFEYMGAGVNAAYHQNTTSFKKGWYVLPSYRYNLTGIHSLTPYVLIDSYSVPNSTAGLDDTKTTRFIPGIRYGFGATVSLKAEYLSETKTEANKDDVKNKAIQFQFAYFFN